MMDDRGTGIINEAGVLEHWLFLGFLGLWVTCVRGKFESFCETFISFLSMH